MSEGLATAHAPGRGCDHAGLEGRTWHTHPLMLRKGCVVVSNCCENNITGGLLVLHDVCRVKDKVAGCSERCT